MNNIKKMSTQKIPANQPRAEDIFGNSPLCSYASTCGYSRLKSIFDGACLNAAGDCGECDLYLNNRTHEEIRKMNPGLDILLKYGSSVI
jgi:hypothetical protein